MPFIQMFQIGCIVVVTAVLLMLDVIARSTKSRCLLGRFVAQFTSPFALLYAEPAFSVDEVQWL